jgi:hypothetical protein
VNGTSATSLLPVTPLISKRKRKLNPKNGFHSSAIPFFRDIKTSTCWVANQKGILSLNMELKEYKTIIMIGKNRTKSTEKEKRHESKRKL